MHNCLILNVRLFFFLDLSKFLHVGCFSEQTFSCIFFGRFALRLRKIRYAKISVSLEASFGDLLLNKEQKKPFVLLNNEVSEFELCSSLA